MSTPINVRTPLVVYFMSTLTSHARAYSTRPFCGVGAWQSWTGHGDSTLGFLEELLPAIMTSLAHGAERIKPVESKDVVEPCRRSLELPASLRTSINHGACHGGLASRTVPVSLFSKRALSRQ